MSYISAIPDSERSNYSTFPNWKVYFQKEATRIQALNPGIRLADLHLNVENIIFEYDAVFNFDLECSVRFTNCYFKRSIGFFEASFSNSISFAQCFCDDEFVISKNAVFKSQFDIIQLNVKRQFLVRGGIFDDCRWSIVQNGILKIGEGDFKHLMLGFWGGMQLESMNLSTAKVTGQISIVDPKTTINKLLILGTSLDLSFIISNIQVNKFVITNFRNSNRFRVDNLTPISNKEETEFTIVESFLGSSEFSSIDFKKYDRFYIYESQISECSWNNIIWRDDILILKSKQVYTTEEEEAWGNAIVEIEKGKNYFNSSKFRKSQPVREYYFKKREVLRQLKFSLGKGGDSVNEQKYHGLEMIAYNKALRWDRHNFSTKLIIKLSAWFSEFGQSFSKPLIALIIGHAALTFLLILNGNFENLTISFSNANKRGVEDAIHQYLYLINPLRKPDDSFKGLSIGLDILMRIWSSYMIYNIIRASRRFIK